MRAGRQEVNLCVIPFGWTAIRCPGIGGERLLMTPASGAQTTGGKKPMFFTSVPHRKGQERPDGTTRRVLSVPISEVIGLLFVGEPTSMSPSLEGTRKIFDENGCNARRSS